MAPKKGLIKSKKGLRKETTQKVDSVLKKIKSNKELKSANQQKHNSEKTQSSHYKQDKIKEDFDNISYDTLTNLEITDIENSNELKKINRAIVEGSFPAFITQEELNSAHHSNVNDTNETENLSKHINNLKTNFLVECFKSTCTANRLLTERDVESYMVEVPPLDFMAKLFNGLDVKIIQKHPTDFIDDNVLNEIFTNKDQQTINFYYYSHQAFVDLNVALLKIKEKQLEGNTIPSELLDTTNELVDKVIELMGNATEESKFLLFVSLEKLLLDIANFSEACLESAKISDDPDDKALMNKVRASDVDLKNTILPANVVYTIIDELQEKRHEINAKLKNLNEDNLLQLSVLSNNRIDVSNEITLRDSLEPNIIEAHLQTFDDYFLISNLIKDANNKLDKIQECEELLSAFASLDTMINEVNKIYNQLQQDMNEESSARGDSAKIALTKLDELLKAHQHYINDIKDSISTVQQLNSNFLDVQRAHKEKIKHIKEMFPYKLLEKLNVPLDQFQLSFTQDLGINQTLEKNLEADYQSDQTTKSLMLSEESSSVEISFTSMDNDSEFSSFDTAQTGIDDEKPSLGDLDETLEQDLKKLILRFYEEVDIFKKRLSQYSTDDKHLITVINTLKRIIDLKENYCKSEKHHAALKNPDNTSFGWSQITDVLIDLNDFMTIGPRTALRLLYLRENIPELPSLININQLSELVQLCEKIVTSTRDDLFQKATSQIKEKLRNCRNIEYVDNNLKAMLDKDIFINVIAVFTHLADEGSAGEFLGYYQQLMNEQAKAIENIHLHQAIPQEEKVKLISEQKQSLLVWKSLGSKLNNHSIVDYFLNIKNEFTEYKELAAKYVNLKIKYGHTFQVNQLNKIETTLNQCELLYQKLTSNYKALFHLISNMAGLSNLPPDMMVVLEPFSKDTIQKELDNAELHIHARYAQSINSLENFQLHFKQGLYFINITKSEQNNFIQALALGMHATFRPSTLIFTSAQAFKLTDVKEERENILEFIKSVVKYDFHNTLIHYKGDENKITQKLNLFLDAIDDKALNSLRNEIKYLITEKKAKNQTNYFNTLNRLSLKTEPYFSREQLAMMINRLTQRLFVSNSDNLPLVVSEFEDIIYYCHSSYFEPLDDNLLSPTTAAQKFIDIAIEKELLDNEFFYKYYEKQNAVHEEASQIPSGTLKISHISDYASRLLEFDRIARKELPAEEQEQALQELIKNIEDNYCFEFMSMSPSEMIHAILETDANNAQKSVFKTPSSLHANRLDIFHQKITYLFQTIIFHEYQNGSLKPRQNTMQAKRLACFFYDVLQQSIRQKAYITFEVMYNILSDKYVNRLLPANKSDLKKYERFVEHNQKTLYKDILKRHKVPNISYIKSALIQTLNKVETKYLSKFVLIGQSVLHINQLKTELLKAGVKANTSLNLFDFMNSVLAFAYTTRYFYDPNGQDYMFELDVVKEHLADLSLFVLPPERENSKRIDEFETINQLVNHLQYSVNKGWGYNITDKNPEARIIEFIEKSLKNIDFSEQTIFPDFNMVMSVFDIFDDAKRDADEGLH